MMDSRYEQAGILEIIYLNKGFREKSSVKVLKEMQEAGGGRRRGAKEKTFASVDERIVTR